MKDLQDRVPKKEAKWPPIAGDYVVGDPRARIAVMTCGSYDLPREVVKRRGNRVAIAGFCETENEGLAKIVQNIVSNSNIRHLLVCGERVRGHEPGQTMIALYSNGLDDKHAVIGSKGTIPTLLPTYFRGDDPAKYVNRLRQQLVSVTDMIDEESIERISLKIDELTSGIRVGPFEDQPIFPPQMMVQNDWKKAVSSYAKRTGQAEVKSRGSLGSMFIFTGTALQVYDVCGVKVGGQRGEYPTVMAGTVFYTRDKIVADPKTGIFDEKAAAEFMNKQDELSLHYSIPAMVHIVAQTTEAMEKYILFTIDHTDSPIIVDSSSMDTRVHGMKLAKDVGVENRTIYNSVISISEEERAALKNIGGVEYAICLAYEESAEDSAKKTSEVLRYYGDTIRKAIIDPGVPRLGRGALSALERSWILKNQLGFPTAIGIHNLHSTQLKRKDIEFGFDYTLPTIFGVDLNLYGPISNATRIFPSVAAANVTVADEANKVLGVLPRRPHLYYDLLGGEGVDR
jgi:tetrahydromethanopterin S-methyltransferase subunit H